MMQQWLSLFVQVSKPVLTTLVYTGINSWLEAVQEELKDQQKQQIKRVFASPSINKQIAKRKQVSLKASKNMAFLPSQKDSELWPLRLSSKELRQNFFSSDSNAVRVFLAPPQKKLAEFSHLNLETRDIEEKIAQNLRDFLQKNYSLQAPAKAIELLSGLWHNHNFQGEASIKVLFNALQSLPTVILKTEVEGSQIIFYLAYWQKNARQYSYAKIFQFNYQTFLQELVKTRVLDWKEVRNQLVTLGKTREDLQRLGGNCELNLPLVEEREMLQAANIKTEKLTFPYQFEQQDFDYLCQFLSICHCLIAGWVADIHYLVNHDIPPHLSIWLPPLEEAISPETTTLTLGRQQANSQSLPALFPPTISLYQDLIAVLADEFSQEVPELALKLADSFMDLSDSHYALAQIEYSFRCWQQQRQFGEAKTNEALALQRISSSLTPRDWQYLAQLQSYLSAFSEETQIIPIKKLVDALNWEKTTSSNLTVSTQSQTNFQLHQTINMIEPKIFSLMIQTNGNQLIGQGENNNLKLWHLNPSQGHLSPAQELGGHSGKILAVAFCSKGQILVGSDTTNKRSYIKIWDLSTGKLKQTLFGHKKPIQALTIHIGFRSFLASGSHKIKLWDLHTGESWLTLFGHKGKVSSLAISNDGQTLISGSEDQTIRIWDLKTGDLHKTLRGHQGSVNTVVLSADGQTLISGSQDKTIKLWDVKTGKMIHTLTGHPGALQVLSLNSQSQYLVSGCDEGIINLWEIETGSLHQTLIGHQKAVQSLAFSNDGQILASTCKAGTLQLWKSCLP